MYDRLYSLEIKHPELDGGFLKIDGDSSLPSCRLRFQSTIYPKGSCTGFVSIGGLNTEIVNTLTQIPRFRFASKTRNQYTLKLSIGYREEGTETRQVVLFAPVVGATPGPHPERMLNFQVSFGNLNGAYLGDSAGWEKKVFKNFLELINACIGKFQDEFHRFSLVNKNGLDFEIDAMRMPLTYEEMLSALPQFYDRISVRFMCADGISNLVIEGGAALSESETASSQSTSEKEDQVESTGLVINVVGVGQRLLDGISEDTGMIGLPRVVPYGCEVDRILKVPTDFGEYKIMSKNIPSLNDYSYSLRVLTLQGDFHGDVWQETLHLYTGDKEKK